MKRLNINIPMELIKEIDRIADERFLTRTALIKIILLDFIIRHNNNNKE
ncbi:MAG: hypothetical protein QXI16_06920 [Sulfolobaceae archaeon]